jgi:hypothetical protein
METGMPNIIGAGCSIHKEITSTDKKMEFVADRMSYVTPRGNWCDIITLNVQDSTREKRDYIKCTFIRNYSMYSIISLSSMRNFCHGISLQRWGGMVFSNQQFGIKSPDNYSNNDNGE